MRYTIVWKDTVSVFIQEDIKENFKMRSKNLKIRQLMKDT